MTSDAPRAGCPLTRRLARFVQLSGEDVATLARLRAAELTVAADIDIVREGAAPRSLILMTEGMAVRYRVLPDGGRQILTFMLPGDLCHAQGVTPRRMDHAIGTVAASRIAPIGRAQFAAALARNPRLATGLHCAALQEEAMLRERIVALGRRDAHGRVAYLLCELLWRLEAVGQAPGRRFCWRLTQTELGDALGLTPVSINRVLRDFRRDGLIAMQGVMLCVLDAESMQRRAGVSRDYLDVRLDGAPPEPPRRRVGASRHDAAPALGVAGAG